MSDHCNRWVCFSMTVVSRRVQIQRQMSFSLHIYIFLEHITFIISSDFAYYIIEEWERDNSKCNHKTLVLCYKWWGKSVFHQYCGLGEILYFLLRQTVYNDQRLLRADTKLSCLLWRINLGYCTVVPSQPAYYA